MFGDGGSKYYVSYLTSLLSIPELAVDKIGATITEKGDVISSIMDLGARKVLKGKATSLHTRHYPCNVILIDRYKINCFSNFELETVR